MSAFDTVLRRASVVTADGTRTLDVGISGETFAEFAPDLTGSCETEIDATGKVLFPGLVDAHVHFNEPGRTEWEGFATGSAALAAGGGTCFIDMPLHSSPPLLDLASFAAKRRAGESNSRLDFALWGGLTPDNLSHLADLARAGVAGFKAFLCPSGLEEFAPANEVALRRGMHVAAEFGLPVAVHAESPATLAAHLARHPHRHPGTMADWLASRPVAAELDAIEMALGCARDTGCALHVVHISSPEGIARVGAAKREGIDVTAETCPHYLLLDTAAAIRIGPAAKCAPPLRPAAAVEGLWRCLAAGEIDSIGSDHSPAPPELKEGNEFFSMWGGIAGCQHGMPLVIGRALAAAPGAAPEEGVLATPIIVSELAGLLGVTPRDLLAELIRMQVFVAPNQAIEPDIAARLCEIHGKVPRGGGRGSSRPSGDTWKTLAALFAANPARRFGLGSRKGRLAAGFDADFCLLAPDDFVIERKDLLSRHPISPYVGMSCGWRVAATWLRGNPVSPASHGRFLNPES
jgi:allantoinase